MPRALVIDLWGSATLRTGGEEIAQGLALMGCRPTWDHATGRVTGIEVLPCRDDRPPARRRDLAHLRTVPRSLPGADRAARRRGAKRSRRATRPTRRIRWRRRGDRRAATDARRSRASSAPRRAPTAPASRTCSGARADRDDARRGLSRRRVARLWRRRRRRHARARRASRSASPAPTCWCTRATIPAAICSKARRTRPSSAALRPRRRRSAATPI